VALNDSSYLTSIELFHKTQRATNDRVARCYTYFSYIVDSI